MKAPIHILYVPGLGDDYNTMRRRLLGLWHYRNVTVELVPVKWAKGNNYQEKYALLSAAIDRAKGKKIVLLGESAGGSLVVNMYADRADDLYKVMTLCGKNTRPDNVSADTYTKNPAFKTSMQATIHSIARMSDRQKRDFVSIHPIYDPTVAITDTLLPGCRQVQLWSVGHFVAIILAITVSSWRLVREARR